jgi:hypothetical protein
MNVGEGGAGLAAGATGSEGAAASPLDRMRTDIGCRGRDWERVRSRVLQEDPAARTHLELLPLSAAGAAAGERRRRVAHHGLLLSERRRRRLVLRELDLPHGRPLAELLLALADLGRPPSAGTPALDAVEGGDRRVVFEEGVRVAGRCPGAMQPATEK